jgi:hypothetical protein
MPFWGLVVTSAGFFIPCVQAIRRRAARYHAILSGALAVTSLFYHGTLHPIAHRVDAVYAHSVGVFHAASLIARPCAQRAASLAVPVYIYFAKSLRTTGVVSSMWHMAFHVTSIFSWTAEIYRSSRGAGAGDDDPNTILENNRGAPGADVCDGEGDVYGCGDGDGEDRADPDGAAGAGREALLPAGFSGVLEPM